MSGKKQIYGLVFGILLLAGIMYLINNNPVSANGLSRFSKMSERNVGFEERANKAGIKNVELPEKLPSNKGMGNLKKVEELQGYVKDENLKDGSSYLKKELLTYEEFINKYDHFSLNPSFPKDRMVWVITTHYPKGVHLDYGVMDNAIIIEYFDAETGESMGYSVSSLNKDGNHLSRPGPKS